MFDTLDAILHRCTDLSGILTAQEHACKYLESCLTLAEC